MSKRDGVGSGRRALWGLVSLALAASGCAPGASPEEVTIGSSNDVTIGLAEQARLAATCGNVAFGAVPPDLNEFPPIGDEARAALGLVGETIATPQPVSSDGSGGSASAPGYEWSLAFESDTEMVLFGQDALGGLIDASFQRRDGAWQPMSWGGCNVVIGAPGYGPAELFTDPSQSPQPSTTLLSLLIIERSCANGAGPEGRNVIPAVTETDSTIEIVVLVEPVSGAATCQGNPPHPIQVALKAPLGNRALLDGHQYPPRPIAEFQEEETIEDTNDEPLVLDEKGNVVVTPTAIPTP